jgi:hypothetical protein
VINFPRADELPMGIEGIDIIHFLASGTDKKISVDEFFGPVVRALRNEGPRNE